MPDPCPILIFDTTLRDGEQSPGYSLHEHEKLRMAHQLARLGVDIIEAGFPVASGGGFPAGCRIATEVKGPIIAALARAKRQDIMLAWETVRRAERPRIHTFLATSDIHLTCKLKITRDQAVEQVRDAVSYARGLCPDVEFSPEDATRSDVEYLCKVLSAAVEAGATTLNIPDTVGYTAPDEFGDLIRTICARMPKEVTISVHCHNDLDLAVANSLAAVKAGARQVECTVNGIGERAGNASLEEVVMALKTRGDFFGGATVAVNTKEIVKSSKLVSRMSGLVVQRSKAIVGENAFAHSSGIHQDGILKKRETYEIMDPQ